jgi:hypothetical protein
MRVVVNFRLRGGAWVIHCTPETVHTPISPIVRTAEPDTLIHLLRYVGANDTDIDQVSQGIPLGRGSIGINLTLGRKNLLHLRQPWSEGLVK